MNIKAIASLLVCPWYYALEKKLVLFDYPVDKKLSLNYERSPYSNG